MTSHFLFPPSSGSNNDSVWTQGRDHDHKQPFAERFSQARCWAELLPCALFFFLMKGSGPFSTGEMTEAERPDSNTTLSATILMVPNVGPGP